MLAARLTALLARGCFLPDARRLAHAMLTIESRRTMSRPLTLSSYRPRGYLSTRWHDLRLGRSEGRLAVYVHYMTTWDFERDHVTVLVPTLAELRAALAAYDPLQWVVGFPKGAQFARKEARLRDALRRGWEDVCDRACAAVGAP